MSCFGIVQSPFPSLGAGMYTNKIQVKKGIFHGTSRNRALYITILYHAIENTEYDIRAPHDGNVGCNTVEYTTAFHCSDWIYFLWHGVKRLIIHQIFSLT